MKMFTTDGQTKRITSEEVMGLIKARGWCDYANTAQLQKLRWSIDNDRDAADIAVMIYILSSGAKTKEILEELKTLQPNRLELTADYDFYL